MECCSRLKHAYQSPPFHFLLRKRHKISPADGLLKVYVHYKL